VWDAGKYSPSSLLLVICSCLFFTFLTILLVTEEAVVIMTKSHTQHHGRCSYNADHACFPFAQQSQAAASSSQVSITVGITT
jgi:hypothetical protein